MKVLRCFLLGVLLAAGTSLAVDVNWLTGIVKAIREEYRIDGQFCLAANIPVKADTNVLNRILSDNKYQNKVKNVIGEKNSADTQVYESDNMVIARPLSPEHAEYRVLSKLQQLSRKSDGNFLLIYSYLSPCDKCTARNKKYNILKKIENHVDCWEDGAFVFTKVYDTNEDGKRRDEQQIENSLNDLAHSMGGLQYIFRCDGRSNSALECHSCSANNRLSKICINNAETKQAKRSHSYDPSSTAKKRRVSHESKPSSSSRSRSCS
ncbi:uncharacterized protein LOC115801409 [Archocentrus centrarchus]|uniref:uncharacterized protein LOC115772978 n=1 Tax=Archocentrus centrarchus TaxID=63155 RepID=UPI0011E9DCEA|nr:uncharacterized protein LOC115772978 [Archocentrus centrarchus]XP_030615070.1 uncharacterized protein LOC115801409 [Archocentrus centrarchus]